MRQKEKIVTRLRTSLIGKEGFEERNRGTSMLRCLFGNPIYKGAYAYGKHHHKYRDVPREKWLIREHAFPAIITDKQWTQAYERVLEETRRPKDGEMIEGLRRVWKRTGKLSNQSEDF